MPSPHLVRLFALVIGGAMAASCSSSGPTRAGSPSVAPSHSTTTIVTPPASTAPTRLRAQLAPWTLPAARSREVALPTVEGLVVAGGLSSAHVSTSTVWTLSPANGRLVHSRSLPVGVHDAAGFVLNRTPYVLAGGNTTTVDDVQAMPTNHRPRIVGHLPQPRSDLSAATVEGWGYALAGFDGSTSLSAVLRTSDGRQFTTFARLRVTVRYAAVAGVSSPAGDQLLVFGGEHDGVPVDDVQDVDLRTGRTRIAGHLPEPLAHAAAFSFEGGPVWIVGGRSHDQLQSRIWRWDPSGHRALPAGRLPYAVADTSVAVVGATAYVVGGETPDPTARVILLSKG